MDFWLYALKPMIIRITIHL